jgi:hypothetical protein
MLGLILSTATMAEQTTFLLTQSHSQIKHLAPEVVEALPLQGPDDPKTECLNEQCLSASRARIWIK